MNDRSEEGTYTWIDGSIYSHTNWTVVEPSVSDEDCVEIIRAGEGSWGTVSCEMIRNTFICRRPSNSTLTTVGIFGELTNEGLDFQILNGNTFLHESTTLVCGGLSDEIIWRFAENAEFTNSEELIATHSNTESGLSWLAINISKQGYYQCRLTAAFSHTIGLYDLSLATVAISDGNYSLSTLIIPNIITLQNVGLYKLHATNWDGQEICAIQINIDLITVISNFDSQLQVEYLVISPASKIYYSNNNNGIPGSMIRWMTDIVKDAEDITYSIEYPNPVLLSTVFSNVGTGVYVFS
ncbi:Macrophage mannose receptor 1-like [Oopsacas minuta]|uniref:Macrophage mannose receptor 1-like n=1 Tax=Oopsacas minuta TaxID=111878 RepID=A0AAV7KAL4_9METZ|nr:Macrophage mannose receptor 1-like [Oopsacas minuta]